MKPRIIIKQKITAFANRYEVLASTEQGKAGELMAFAQQKRLNFKEKVLFYHDASKRDVLFTFRAEKVFDIHGHYIVEDENGVRIGSFKKQFTQSLAVSTWSICDASGDEVYTVRESNVVVAVLRRYAGYIPFAGDILSFILNFIKYHFEFIRVDNQEIAGKYQKTTLFRDHYLLSSNKELWQQVDWRVLAAMSVALDALQSR